MAERGAETGRGRSRVLGLAVALLCALTAALPAPAPASTGQVTIFDAAGGLTSVGPAQQAQMLDRLHSLGVDVVRIVIPWRAYVPNPGASKKPAGFDAGDPSAYPQGPFNTLDAIIRGAYARGMTPLLTPSSPIPDWASASGRSYLVNPDPDEFQRFVHALGARYSGSFCPTCAGGGPCVGSVCVDGSGGSGSNNPLPRVVFWSMWNEPNLPIFLRPQHENGRAVGGRLYRQLWLAGKDGLTASGHGADPVLIGETSPGPGRGGTSPLTFMRQALCLNGNFRLERGCQRIDAVGWAHHPYDPYDPPFSTSRGLLTIRTLGKLESGLARAARGGATAGRLPVYVTEYGVESVPDREFGVSQQRQAAYIAIAEYLLWRDPNVAAYAQYLMDDDGGGLKYSFQTGLRFANDAPKLSYSGFGIPLVAQRRGGGSHGVRMWGYVRPGKGPYQVHVLFRDGHGKVQKLRNVRTDGAGYFQFKTAFHGGRRWRAVARGPDGTLLKGPFVSSYVFRG